MNKYYLIFCFIVLSSVTSSTTVGQTVAFQELSYRSVTLSEVKRPTALKVIPAFNLLIVTDGAAGYNEPVYYAYTLDSIKFIKSFITMGEGEHQVLTQSPVEYLSGERFVRMFDINMQRFSEVAIDAIVKPGATVTVKRYMGRDSATKKIQVRGFAYRTPYYLSDKLGFVDLNHLLNASFQFGLNGYDGSKTDPLLLRIFSNNGVLKSEVGKLPSEIVREIEKSGISYFAGAMGINDKGDKFIYRCYFANFIALYDLKGNLLAWHYGTPENEGKIDKNTLFVENNNAYFSGTIRMYKNRVYA